MSRSTTSTRVSSSRRRSDLGIHPLLSTKEGLHKTRIHIAADHGGYELGRTLAERAMTSGFEAVWHGSDAPETAAVEVAFFFPGLASYSR